MLALKCYVNVWTSNLYTTVKTVKYVDLYCLLKNVKIS